MALMKKNNDIIIRWNTDSIHPGARFDILDRKGREVGRVELLSMPIIEPTENEGYVNLKIKAACIGKDGEPMTRVQLRKEYYLDPIDENIELSEVLTSFRVMLEHLIWSLERDLRISEIYHKWENIRNSFFFHYILLERRIADLYPSYLVRIRRIATIADEGWEQIMNRYAYGQRDGDVVDYFRSALEMLNMLQKEIPR